ncbi:MAG: putative Ig domain-containing protein [Blastocatellia bacterium]|nr:putative Ig domain-containing protein [Blastocatellia bacterium]
MFAQISNFRRLTFAALFALFLGLGFLTTSHAWNNAPTADRQPTQKMNPVEPEPEPQRVFSPNASTLCASGRLGPGGSTTTWRRPQTPFNTFTASPFTDTGFYYEALEFNVDCATNVTIQLCGTTPCSAAGTMNGAVAVVYQAPGGTSAPFNVASPGTNFVTSFGSTADSGNCGGTNGLPSKTVSLNTGRFVVVVTGIVRLGFQPTAAREGTYNIGLSAANGSCNITQAGACPTITVTNPATATGTVGNAFSQTFTQTGGVATPITFTTSSTLPTGLTLNSNGNLSGTPTQTGTFPITVRATDNNGCFGTGATYNLTISCPTVTVTNPATATGTRGTSFSQTFTQTGATGTVTFSTASTLPNGLTLSTGGVLSGTPTQTGTFPITVTATGQAGCTGTGTTYNLVISCQTITVTNPGTASGTRGSAFSQTFTQTGAIGGATFTTASTLPNGISLSTGGVLAGTPTQTGTFPVVVTVTDGGGCTGTGTTYNLVISCQTITVTNPGTATGTRGSAFSQTFTQTGAIGGATFTTASTLPNGISLSTGGVLAGTPTQTGTFPVVVTVTDGGGCTGTGKTSNLVIACQTITVTNPATSTGIINVAFSQTFTQTGAIGGATFTTASTLPSGLTLSAGGVLAGTPTQTGTFPVVVTVTDGGGCTGTGATYNLVISSILAPRVFVADTYNNRVQKYEAGVWTVLGAGQFNGPEAVAADPTGTKIYVADTGNNKVQYSTDSGSTWSDLTTTGQVTGPQGVAVDIQGNVYISNSGGGTVLRFNGGTPSASPVVIYANGTGTNQVQDPRGLAIDINFRLFVADRGATAGTSGRVLSVTTANATPGTYAQVAGYGVGSAPFMQVKNPEGVALDDAGNLFIADTGNNRVLRRAGGTGGAGTVLCPISGSLTAPALGQVRGPEGVTIVDAALLGGTTGQAAIIVSDTQNQRIQGSTTTTSNTGYGLVGSPNGNGTGTGQFKSPGKIK